MNNRELEARSVAAGNDVRGGADKEDEETHPEAPPQVLYCGPSNKSVDVVTGRNVVINRKV